MKTTTIKMNGAKGKNIFAGAQWKEATFEEQAKVFAALSKIQKSKKQHA